MPLYHYTDTARLPWILRSGELRASANRIKGFPPDVLWATTNPQGDWTSSANRGLHFERGELLHCRFVLDEADFEPWKIARDELGWSAKHLAALEMQKKAEPQNWWIRRDPLALGLTPRIETKAFRDRVWTPAEATAPAEFGVRNALEIYMCGQRFASIQTPGESGGFGYGLVAA